MASFLDTNLVGTFSLIFTFFLVYGVLWGLLVTRKPFGDNKGLYAIISLMVAFLVIISRPARSYIEFITPWMLVLAVAVFFIVIVFSMFAPVEWDKVVKNTTVHTWIIILIAIVLVGGLAYTFGQASLSAQTGEVPANAYPVLDEEGNVIDYSASGNLPPGPVVGGGTGVATSDYSTNLVNTLVHPKVLGLALIFLLSCLVVFFLSKPAGGS